MRAQAFIYAIVALIAIAYLVAPATAETYAQMKAKCGSSCNSDQKTMEYIIDQLTDNRVYGVDLEGRTIRLTKPLGPTSSGKSVATAHALTNGKLVATGSGWNRRVRTVSCQVDDDSFVASCSGSGFGSYRFATVFNENAYMPGTHIRSVSGSRLTMSTKALRTGTFSLRLVYYDAVLDFSSLAKWSVVTMLDLDIDGAGKAAGLRLPPSARGMEVRECSWTRLMGFAVQETGVSNGVWIVNSEMSSNERSRAPAARESIGIYLGVDSKLSGCTLRYFRHSFVNDGSGIVSDRNTFDQSTTAGGTHDYPAAVVVGDGGSRMPLVGVSMVDGGVLFAGRPFINYLSFFSMLDSSIVVNAPNANWRPFAIRVSDYKGSMALDGFVVRRCTFRSRGASVPGLIRKLRGSVTIRGNSQVEVTENTFYNVRNTCWPCSGSYGRSSGATTWGFKLTGKRLLLGKTASRLLYVHPSGIKVNGKNSNARPHSTVDGQGKATFRWPGKASGRISYAWTSD